MSTGTCTFFSTTLKISIWLWITPEINVIKNETSRCTSSCQIKVVCMSQLGCNLLGGPEGNKCETEVDNTTLQILIPTCTCRLCYEGDDINLVEKSQYVNNYRLEAPWFTFVFIFHAYVGR